ncbi:hypothetical protein F4604DRAFT_1935236 [Suillus subluteus]|nr:hypothetical protein F4604DRAFT_1935236 [Suillus subluteus]
MDRTEDEPDQWSGSNHGSELDHGSTRRDSVKATEKRMMRLFEEEIQQLKQELEKRNDPPVKKVKIRPPKKDRAPKTEKEPKGSNPVKEMLDKMGSKPSKRGDRATPPAVDAVAQIAPKSYLGHAFTKIKPKKKNVKQRKGQDAEDSPSSMSSLSSSSPGSESLESSSSSSSSSETTESLESSESSDLSETSGSDSTARKRKRDSKKHKSHKKEKSSKRKSTLKPIPPTEYDSAEDSRVFH